MQPRQALAQSGEGRGETRVRAALSPRADYGGGSPAPEEVGGFWCQRRQKFEAKGMEQHFLPSPPPSPTGLALTSALIGALCVHTELVGSTAGLLCATLVDVCREAGRAGISIPIALAGKPRQGCWGMDLPTLRHGPETTGCVPTRTKRCSWTLGCPARDYAFQSALQLSVAWN